MSDNLRRFRAVRDAIKQLYPGEPTGNQARHLTVLAAMISGIIGSQSTQLPKIAAHLPGPAKAESRAKRLSRWINDEDRDYDLYYLPFAQALLAGLAQRTLVLVIDGSAVGRGCVTLMVSVVYRGRALPVAWVVYPGQKGHFPEDVHVALLEAVQEDLVPADSDVIVLGDGEFDGPTLQATLDGFGWQYACRTAQNTILSTDEEEFSFADLAVGPGECLAVPEVRFTRQGYGPVLAVAWWRKDCQAPLYLVSNMDLPDEVRYWYGKRFRIETFFSDQKSRGFHLDKSHLSDPMRLSRLMIAAGLAYLWMIYLGALAMRDGWHKIIHRTDRCDLSLFQLGLRLLEYFLDEDKAIPVTFQLC